MNTQPYPLSTPSLELRPGVQPAMQPNDPGSLSARDILNIFIRYKMMIVVIVLIVTGVVALRELLAKPEYLATAVTKVEVLPSNAGIQVTPQEREMRLDTQTKLMASGAMAQVVAGDLKLHRNAVFMERTVPVGPLSSVEEKNDIEAAAEKLQAQSEVKRPLRTQLIQVSVVTPSPRLSVSIADHYVTALQNWEDRARVKRRQQALAYLGPQLKLSERKFRRPRRSC